MAVTVTVLAIEIEFTVPSLTVTEIARAPELGVSLIFLNWIDRMAF
jgi:hypothetical protein